MRPKNARSIVTIPLTPDQVRCWSHEGVEVSLATTLNRALDPSKTSIDDGWVGLEPTFQSKKIIKLYAKYEDDDEDSYFEHRYIRKTVRKVVLDIERRWRKHKHLGDSWALFDDVRAQEKRDPWNVMRAECDFKINRCERDFELKLGVDPATFEFGAKPIPIAWLYDDRFVQFLEELAFKVPKKNGLTPSLLNGGGQFHLSAKCFLTGSLLADDIASRVDHPELATWMMDWPNCDDRAFRATSARFNAFR